jgi:hypothetical protein
MVLLARRAVETRHAELGRKLTAPHVWLLATHRHKNTYGKQNTDSIYVMPNSSIQPKQRWARVCMSYLWFGLLVGFSAPVAQRCAAQVSQPDAALAAAEGKHAAVRGVEVGACDHLQTHDTASKGSRAARKQSSRECYTQVCERATESRQAAVRLAVAGLTSEEMLCAGHSACIAT